MHARSACSLANLFSRSAAGAGQRRLEMGIRDRVSGLLSALPILEVRFADKFPADTDPFLDGADYGGVGILLLLLDQKGSQTSVVSAPITATH
jgi:hypothetical protein